MKHIKKLASLLLALVMALSLAVTAFAAETYSITINNSAEGHTYEAYQIFTGDLVEKDGTKILSNIVWGSGISEAGQTALGDAAAKAETLTTEADVKAFAKAVAPYLTTAAGSANTPTDGKYVISGLDAGYYLVKDKDNSLANTPDAYTEYIVKVVSNVEASPKSDVPEVEKKVKDTNDSTGVTSGWQDSADYDIGDSIPFQLKATLANNVSSYTTYKVVFHDTLSKGLTLNATYGEGQNANVVTSGVTVKVGDADKTANFVITAVKNADGTTTLTVSCDDVKALGAGNSSVITVDYTAKLNENAVLGSAGNPNEVYLEYSNNPNKSEAGNNETGKTPEDTVIVFTYKTIVNKVTKNPAYDPEKDTDKTGTDSDGDKEYISLEGAGFTLYKKVLGTVPSGKNYEVVKDDSGIAIGYWLPIGNELKGDKMTTFTWSGLDDGDYKLVETTTPAGYNTIADIEFTITAGHVDGDSPYLNTLSGDVTSGTATFTAVVNDGSLSTDVVNNSGTQLPSTGGMGTTIFYVLGSILVLGAAVLLVTKKRMSGAEK